MKQVLQSLKTGETSLVEVPAPAVGPGQVLVRSACSLLSAGTERMLVEFGKAGWLAKARQQPDKVRMVLDKLRTDGLGATLDAVRSKLDQPLALGYCNVGTVLAVGTGVTDLEPGDRVISNGKHAEIVCVPRHLCARVPEGVDDETAVFTVLAAIGLQGLRLAEPTLGECVVVTGLGLVGLLTVQLLRAQGCRVLGIDTNAARVALARSLGAEAVNPAAGADVLAAAQAFSRGRGVDAVLITASTRSDEPVHQAAQMCRQRGRIVLVGVTGLALSRADFYAKELRFQVSCSYGPGRYDPAYEEGGQDYPVGFVRWTEQRNFEAVLDLMAAGQLQAAPLISHRYALAEALEAYALLAGAAPSLGIVLRYPAADVDAPPQRAVPLADAAPAPGKACVAFLGAGNYAGRVLIPAFRAAGATLHTVVSASGVSAVHHGRKQGFAQAASDADAVLGDVAIDTVVIATRHHQHAAQVLAALGAGKHVFCEKPLCLTEAELEAIAAAAGGPGAGRLMVGFNRRFAPQVVRMHALLGALAAPRACVMTVNAGAVPATHWVRDPALGGGRIVGEACHFIDLLRHLVGAAITGLRVQPLRLPGDAGLAPDSASLTLDFADGSIGTIHYLANGNPSYPKERLEVFCAGRVLQLDNFRRLRGWGWPGFRGTRLWRQDKGQRACAAAFVAAIRGGGPSPIPLAEIIEVSRVSIAAQQAVEAGA